MVDVSYIIPTYNKDWIIDKTWQSLHNQEGDFTREFIFCDDNSQDDTVKKLENIANHHPNVKVIKNLSNQGPSINVNIAVKHAEGTYCHIVDGDDRLPHNATITMLNIARKYQCPLIYGRQVTLDIHNTPPAIPQIIKKLYINTHNNLAFACYHKITHPALLVSKDLYINAGGADEKIFVQDQSLAWRLSYHTPKMALLDIASVYKPPNDVGKRLSKNKSQLHHDVILAAYYMLQYPNLTIENKKFFHHRIIANLWKDSRDHHNFFLTSPDFWRYIWHKIDPRYDVDYDYDDILQKIKQWRHVRRM